MKKFIIKLLRIFTILWAVVGFAIILLSFYGFYIKYHNLWAFFKELREIYSPFNLWNTFLVILLFSPSLIAYILHNKLKKLWGMTSGNKIAPEKR